MWLVRGCRVLALREEDPDRLRFASRKKESAGQMHQA